MTCSGSESATKLTKTPLYSLLAGLALTMLAAGCEGPVSQANAQSADKPAADQPAAADAASSGAAEFATDIEKASYAVGYQVAGNLKQQLSDSLDADALIRGISDQLADRDSLISQEDAEASLRTLAEAQQLASAARAADNESAGGTFLAENGAREGVVTLPSGLQYEVLTAAEGAKPTATDQVTTHYRGTLIDGTEFDSSYQRGQPATFPLNGVIPGWTEALQLMSVGAKWRLFIPSQLAYGAQDRPGIPANSTLIFDVELLEIAGG